MANRNRLFEDFKSFEIEVGIIENKRHPRGGDLGTIYAVQENGTNNIPARPTLKPAIESFGERKMAEKVIDGVFDGLSGEESGERLAVDLKRAVKDEIRNKTSPRLAKSTIDARRRRGNSSDKPLIDTGTLLNSIDAKVN